MSCLGTSGELVVTDLKEFSSNEVSGFRYKEKETVVVVGGRDKK